MLLERESLIRWPAQAVIARILSISSPLSLLMLNDSVMFCIIDDVEEGNDGFKISWKASYCC